MEYTNDIQLLNYMRQNTEMGVDGIDMIYEHVKNEEFKKTLSVQRDQYTQFFSRADSLLRQKQGEPEDVSVMAKMSSTVMGKVKNLAGQTDSKYAEDMIKGTSMGVTKLTKHLHEYMGDDKKVTDLANELLGALEGNINSLKAYL